MTATGSSASSANLAAGSQPSSGASTASLWKPPSGPGAQAGRIVIPHFVGASASSTSVRQLLRRLCHELAAGAGITDEIPDDYEKLREAFPAFLEKAAASKHLVILIDAVNQLDVALQAHAMRWLPDTLPAGARIILTTLPGPALDALRARRQPPVEVPLPALQASDQAAIMDGYLARYRKSLDAAQRSALLGKADAGVPLYLLTALEELRTLGTYEEIAGRIRALPDRVRPLFAWILERLERDPGFRDQEGRLVGPGLVGPYCSFIAVGRLGHGAGRTGGAGLTRRPGQRDSAGRARECRRLAAPVAALPDVARRAAGLLPRPAPRGRTGTVSC